MKKIICSIVSILLLATSAFAVDRTSVQDGDWTAPQTWGGATAFFIPNGGQATVIHDVYLQLPTGFQPTTVNVGISGTEGTFTLKTKVGGGVQGAGDLICSDLVLGQTDSASLAGELSITGEGSLTVTNDVRIGHNGLGQADVAGGALTVANDLYVSIGAPVSHSADSDGSTLSISNGTVTAGGMLRIGVQDYGSGVVEVAGGTLAVTSGFTFNNGTFTMNGSSGDVTISSSAETVPTTDININPDAEFKFIFDENGVASIGFDNKGIRLQNGASLSIDGSSYTGSDTNFVLIDSFAGFAGNLSGTNQFANVSITGFGEPAAVEYDSGMITLVLGASAVSPASIVGWSVWSNNVMRMVVDVPDSARSFYYPKITTNLIDGIWTNIAHSINGSAPFVVTNLAYSATNGDDEVIYVQMDASSKFFRIEQ